MRRLVLLAVVALGIAWGLRQPTPAGPTVGEMIPMAAGFIGSWLRCNTVGCPAELIEGMEEKVFASGELLPAVPVAVDADEWGRLYVAEGGRINGGVEDNRFRSEAWYQDDLAARSVADRRAYIERALARGEFEDPDAFSKIADRLIRLDDTDGDGVADRSHEVARFSDVVDGPAAGVLAHEGDVWVTEIPSVYRFRDADGDADGLPEQKEVLTTGYGVKTSLMGHDLHGLAWGPDGRIYFSMGDRGYRVSTADGRVLEPTMGPGRGAVFRMWPDGRELEVFATGVRNPQELAFDDEGHLFTVDNNGDGGDEARLVYLVEGGETGWAMPYQTLIGDYVRGPWVAEGLWKTHHEGRPAWALPPVAYLATGPSGLAAYPGLGLPERYRDHFFVCDYRYMKGASGVIAFAAEPKGASFELVDEHMFAGSLLATDVDFAMDGTLFVSIFDQIGQSQEIVTLRHASAEADPRIAEAVALAREGMQGRELTELTDLLAHADRRIRRRAQFELARRAETDALLAVARDPARGKLARLHATWGLGQIGTDAFARLGDDFAWAADEPALLHQAIKVAGDVGASPFVPALRAGLRDASPRTRFFAAQSLGALGAREAVPELIDVLRQNADDDVFLRHAAVWALHRIGDVDAVLDHADDASASVRLGVLLTLRHAADPRTARFLTDSDPFLVLEAARAIYDLPIAEALPALAALPAAALPSVDDPQSSHALHRRVIGANRAVGSEAAAVALAAHAANPDHPEAMRRLALESLGEFLAPGSRDLTMGFHRPLGERPAEVVHAAWDRHGPALVAGDLGGRALELSEAHGRVPLDDDALVAQAEDEALGVERRLAAFRVLAGRGSAADRLPTLLDAMLASGDAALRVEAREQLSLRDPAAALASARGLRGDAPLAERQHALALAGRTDHPDAVALLEERLAALEAGEVPGDLWLDTLLALRARTEPALQERLLAFESRTTAAAAGDLTAARAWALEGGDAARGELVFQGAGDCQRCHSGGHGAVGPDLAGLPARSGAEQMLRSVVDPQAEIAPGFANIVVTRRDGSIASGVFLEETAEALRLREGDTEIAVPLAEIASRSPLSSGMPPMGLALAPEQLRDLIAYLQTL